MSQIDLGRYFFDTSRLILILVFFSKTPSRTGVSTLTRGGLYSMIWLVWWQHLPVGQHANLQALTCPILTQGFYLHTSICARPKECRRVVARICFLVSDNECIARNIVGVIKQRLHHVPVCDITSFGIKKVHEVCPVLIW